MNRKSRTLFVFSLVLVFVWTFLPAQLLSADEPVDLEAVARIRDEGIRNSKVMETLAHLTDNFGARLTGSPQLKAAMEWCAERLKGLGLANAHLDPWGDFGRGWEIEKASVHMIKPAYYPITAMPEAWTGGSGGVIKGTPILFNAVSTKALEAYKGKLKGAIVLLGDKADVRNHYTPAAVRHSEEDLKKLTQMRLPGARGGGDMLAHVGRTSKNMKFLDFLEKEGVAVILKPGRGSDGTFTVQKGGSYKVGDPEGLCKLSVVPEHYNRLVRLLEKKVPVEMEIEVKVRFHEKDTKGYNVIAEIPGTDRKLKNEVVMLGGHIDSWHGATGATDNGAGVSVAMEALRILKTLDLAPRRTIRIALWDGEEQGLLGSGGYVKKHFGGLEGEVKPAHSKVSAYFNLDNGTGKVRGIYMQGNDQVRPIFTAWLKPFHDLGANTVSIRGSLSTDHRTFDSAGIPGFTFIQDPIAYRARTWHTNMDDLDHIEPGDLMQASVIMASFVYHAAMRSEKIPRLKVKRVKGITLEPETLSALVGEYESEAVAGFVGNVTVEEGKLFLKAAGYPKVQLTPTSDTGTETRCIIKRIGATTILEKDSHGNGLTMRFSMPGAQEMVFRRVNK